MMNGKVKTLSPYGKRSTNYPTIICATVSLSIGVRCAPTLSARIESPFDLDRERRREEERLITSKRSSHHVM